MDRFREQLSSFEDLEQFRQTIGYPGTMAANKIRTSLDEGARAFIAQTPFIVLSTSDADGSCDSSPRGDAPGFVLVLDDKHLFIPERPGNRILDSVRNILSNPSIGILFTIPGLEETLRINGKACVTRDPELLQLTAVRGKEPLMGIGVEIEECYLHCGKSLKRSGLWHPETWLSPEARVSASKLLAAHISANTQTSITPDEVDKSLQESYTKRLY